MNTRLEYQYRDAHNYKTFGETILAGSVTLAQLQPYFYERTFFMPSEIGLRDLQEFPYRECDHIWHELTTAETTSEPPDSALTAQMVLQRFQAAAEMGWDTNGVRARMVELP